MTYTYHKTTRPLARLITPATIQHSWERTKPYWCAALQHIKVNDQTGEETVMYVDCKLQYIFETKEHAMAKAIYDTETHDFGQDTVLPFPPSSTKFGVVRAV